MRTVQVITINTLKWPKWLSCTPWWVYRWFQWGQYTGFWCFVNTIRIGWQGMKTLCSLMILHLALLECFIKIGLFRHSSNIIFLTDWNSQNGYLEGALYCIKNSLSLDHFTVNLSSDVGSVVSSILNGYSGILLVFILFPNNQYNVKLINMLHYKVPTGQAHDNYLQSNFEKVQWWSSNNLSISKLSCRGSLRPHMHFTVKRIHNA